MYLLKGWPGLSAKIRELKAANNRKFVAALPISALLITTGLIPE
jgi:hypothetical protein